MKKHLLLDIEASGLIGPAGEIPSEIFCICTEELETGVKRDFIGDSIYTEFRDYFNSFDVIVGHNIIGYDVPVLRQHCKIEWHPTRVIDTLVLSKLFNPDRGKTGKDVYIGSKPHSLEAWGVRCGLAKQEFKDFTKFSHTMLEYCRNDVDVLRRMYFMLMSEKEKYGFSDWCINIENRVRAEIVKQQWNGFTIDVEKLESLHNNVLMHKDILERDIVSSFKPIPVQEKVITPKYKADGGLSVVNIKHLTAEERKCVGLSPEHRGSDLDGSFSKIFWSQFDPNSSKQVVDRMNKAGWKPSEKTLGHIKFLKDIGLKKRRKKTLTADDRNRLAYFKEYGWRVCEENLNTLPLDAPKSAKSILKYVQMRSRQSLIETQWWPNIHTDNKIHGGCDSLGAGTHRMTHSRPNMANIPAIVMKKDASGKEVPLKGYQGGFAYECREVWTIDDKENYVNFGADVSGLEGRLCAHFMNDLDYIRVVTEGRREDGTDLHSVNMKAAGVSSIAIAKRVYYAILYGAGAEKLGSTIGGTPQEGAALKKRFLDNLAPLGKLISDLENSVKLNGFIEGLDGRKFHVRSMHKALNTLLQGNGAVVCKHWLVHIMNSCRKLNLDVMLLNSIHDEYQFRVHKKHVKILENICHAAIKKVEEELGLRCPLACSTAVGYNWAETH